MVVLAYSSPHLSKPMYSLKSTKKNIMFSALFFPFVLSIYAPETSLPLRVEAAKYVCVGKVINKVVKGDWANADILVIKPLKNTKKGEEIPVTWRVAVSGRPIYDVKKNSCGIAILGATHKERYWLRGDKFENLNKLKEVKKILQK